MRNFPFFCEVKALIEHPNYGGSKNKRLLPMPKTNSARPLVKCLAFEGFYWKKGRYLDNNTVEFKDGRIAVFVGQDLCIKRVFNVDHPTAIKKFTDKHWAELKSVLGNALAKFCPKSSVEYNDSEYMAIVDKNLTIMPVVSEVEKIDSFEEEVFWELSVEIYYPGSYDTPPDGDVETLSTSRHVEDIVRKLIDTIVGSELDGYFENVRYSKISDELDHE